MENDWATWGTIGDTIGGLANAVTMLIAVIATLWARNEVRRTREHHTYERKVEAVRASVQMLLKLSVIIELAGQMREDGKLVTFGERLKDEAFSVLMDMALVASDAGLFIKGTVIDDLRNTLSAFSRLAPVLGQAGKTAETDKVREELSSMIRKVTQQLAAEIQPR